MTIPHPIVTPYPPALTDASWKAAKTAGIRDKWNTELGAALRAAQTAYNLIHFDRLDLATYEVHHPALRIIRDVELAKTAAKQHQQLVVKPAIKALETAKTKAAVARLNPVITAAARTKAGQMENFLGSLITNLKAFSTTDYDARQRQLVQNFQQAKATFTTGMDNGISGARKFINKVRKNPTVAVYNGGVMQAARNLTQQLGQVDRMQKSGFDLGKHGATAQELFNQLDPRANGHADLAANANAAAVTQAIDQFADILDDVVEWWS